MGMGMGMGSQGMGMGMGDIFGSMGMGGMHGMHGMHQGMHQGMNRRPRKSKPIVHDLPVSLEDLYKGLTKKLKITRKKYNPQTQRYADEKKVVTIVVKPGWKAGTKITFDGYGDEGPGIEPADIVFVIREKPHDTYKREGNNLVYRMTVNLRQALCGFKFKLPSLDGKQIPIDCSDDVGESLMLS